MKKKRRIHRWNFDAIKSKSLAFHRNDSISLTIFVFFFVLNCGHDIIPILYFSISPIELTTRLIINDEIDDYGFYLFVYCFRVIIFQTQKHWTFNCRHVDIILKKREKIDFFRCDNEMKKKNKKLNWKTIKRCACIIK